MRVVELATHLDDCILFHISNFYKLLRLQLDLLSRYVGACNCNCNHNVYTGQLVEPWGVRLCSGKSEARISGRSNRTHSVANGSPPLQHFFERNSAVRVSGRNDEEISPANSFRASALCSEYNEKLDLITYLFTELPRTADKELWCHLPTCLPHTMEASYCLMLSVRQGLWNDSTRTRTRVYRFSSRLSISIPLLIGTCNRCLIYNYRDPACSLLRISYVYSFSLTSLIIFQSLLNFNDG